MSNEKSSAAVKRERMVEALKAERENLARAGKTARVAEIDASIKALGGQAPAGRRSAPSATA